MFRPDPEFAPDPQFVVPEPNWHEISLSVHMAPVTSDEVSDFLRVMDMFSERSTGANCALESFLSRRGFKATAKIANAIREVRNGN